MIQLKTFAVLPPTVYGFLLGRIKEVWLRLEEESGRYTLGYCKRGNNKIGNIVQRFIDEDILCNRTDWIATRGW